MSYVETFELFGHLKGRIEIGDEVITPDFIFSPKLVHDELRIAVGLEIPYSKLVRKLQANEQGIVFCDIVGTGSIRKNARGMTLSRGEMRMILTPATSPPRGMVRDAPSKYICQTGRFA